MAALEAELERARAEVDELSAQLSEARREQAQHAEREQALKARTAAAERGAAELKQALSNLLSAALEAQTAADSVDALQHELDESPPE